MSLILAYKSRGLTRDITILDAAGAAIVPGMNDKVRATILHEGQAAKLTVSSDAATANGSSFTKNSPSSGVNRLRLDASDLAFDAGTYTLKIDYFDNADAQEWKLVQKQVFVLEEVSGMLDISELLLELGLAATVTDTERAVLQRAIKSAEGAIRRHLRYSPAYATHTEYYPQQSYDRSGGLSVWEVNDTQAYERRVNTTSTEELFLKNIPIRSITSLAIDYDGRSGSKAGGFTDLKTEGEDFWPNYDMHDSSGNKVCSDGILRSHGLWPSEPGSIKIVYVAGYTHAELMGQDSVIDASPIGETIIKEAGRRAKAAILGAKKTGVGFAAGPFTSESLGDYSYSIDSSQTSAQFSGKQSLLAESVEALAEYVNYGWAIAP